MADYIDDASELQELFLDKALREHKERTRVEHQESQEFCIECEDVIPEKRRELLKGVQTCVYCQSILELKAKNGR